MLHPRYKRYFRQTLAFGVIWLAFGLIYVFLEAGLLGRLTVYPTTGNRYNFQNSLVFISIGSFFMGLLQGWIEVAWLRRRFVKKSLWVKIVFKGTVYLLLIILFLIALTYATTNYQTDAVVQFIRRFSFWSIVLYAGAIINIALFFSEVGEHMGNGMLMNYFLGKYHNPNQETRIFMFLDMKSSTTIAEKIGHEKYFDLIKAYYDDMTDAILETSGEIYQYVGDEIVVTWPKNVGIYANNCIQCFAKISQIFEQNKDGYLKRFGLVPEFKAGYHLGEVTSGEIGIIKKDIIFTGDVLNTTARIQGQCNTYNAKALISGDLLDELQKEDPISFTRIGELVLRGKIEPIQLFKVEF